ncbi:MAG: hypothetical protein GW947_03665 [Candidatus Pacebacteria bacterium]|nr:hypothetical protein [Candidatus Paceibacterota bacterium]
MWAGIACLFHHTILERSEASGVWARKDYNWGVKKRNNMKKNQIVKQNSFTEFLLYKTPNGKVKVEIFLCGETIWLTQAKIAELFGVDRSVVTKHLQNIYTEGELIREATSAK